MESAQNVNKLGNMPIGARLMVRSKTDWRFAAISRIAENIVTISVVSASGRTYRIRRDISSEIDMVGDIPALHSDNSDTWQENFAHIDVRW